MKIAACMVTQDYDIRMGTYECLRSLSDFITILADCPTTQVWERLSSFKDKPDELISLYRRPETLWNDTANRTMLMYRAYLAGCELVLPWSSDVLPSKALFDWIMHTKTVMNLSIEQLLDGQERTIPVLSPFDFFQVKLCELWGSIGEWRSDGVWNDKRNVFMQRNWLFNPCISMPLQGERLHQYPFPRDKSPVTQFMDKPEFRIYHLGSLTPEMRRARVAKYSREDAGNHFQSDYAYLADETGLDLTKVPQEDVEFMRRWTPL